MFKLFGGLGTVMLVPRGCRISVQLFFRSLKQVVSWQGREVISLFINPRLLSFSLTAGMTPTVGPTWWVVPFQLQSEVTCIESTYPILNKLITGRLCNEEKKGAFLEICGMELYILEDRQDKQGQIDETSSFFHCWFPPGSCLLSSTWLAKICLFHAEDVYWYSLKPIKRWSKLLERWSVPSLCKSKVEFLIAFLSFCLQMACMLCLSPLAPWPWLACWQSSLTRWVGT